MADHAPVMISGHVFVPAPKALTAVLPCGPLEIANLYDGGRWECQCGKHVVRYENHEMWCESKP